MSFAGVRGPAVELDAGVWTLSYAERRQERRWRGVTGSAAGGVAAAAAGPFAFADEILFKPENIAN